MDKGVLIQVISRGAKCEKKHGDSERYCKVAVMSRKKIKETGNCLFGIHSLSLV
jgi:hypothetical protein